MNAKQTFLWMGFVALAFALFWHIWNLIAGSIPSVSELAILNTVWEMPFTISHSWSVLLAPLFVPAFLWFFSRVKAKTEEEILLVSLTPGVGLIFGFSIAMGYHEAPNAQVILWSMGLVVGLCVSLLSSIWGIKNGIRHTATYGLGFGFGFGLSSTMPLGIIAGLFLILPLSTFLLSGFFTKQIIKSLWNQLPNDDETERGLRNGSGNPVESPC